MTPLKKALTAVASVAVLAVGLVAAWPRDQGVRVTLAAPVTIPFESLNGLIAIPIRINESAPLLGIVDTGAKPSIVAIERAREMGLALQGAVKVGGTGSGAATGAFVQQAALTLDALTGFSQPVTLAIPLDAIARRIGRRIDGIVGTDFLRSFVTEVDYERHVLTLHDAQTFVYRGTGTVVPMALDTNGHPTVTALVTPVGKPEIEATIKLDLGGSGSITLHTPLVQRHGMTDPGVPTTRVIGATGMGGRVAGRTGRLASFTIGGVIFERPVAVFAADTAGAYATASIDAHVGARIASRFRVFLDFVRGRLILEPNASAGATFDRPSAGVALEADGPDYRTLRVIDVLEDGPGATAGIRAGDVITSVDGSTTMTLLEVLRRFELATPCELVLLRSGQPVKVTVTPRVIT